MIYYNIYNIYPILYRYPHDIRLYPHSQIIFPSARSGEHATGTGRDCHGRFVQKHREQSKILDQKKSCDL